MMLRAFVGEVGEEAHHADHQHELDRRREPPDAAAINGRISGSARFSRLHREVLDLA